MVITKVNDEGRYGHDGGWGISTSHSDSKTVTVTGKLIILTVITQLSKLKFWIKEDLFIRFNWSLKYFGKSSNRRSR
jgi:hypothetical protein